MAPGKFAEITPEMCGKCGRAITLPGCDEKVWISDPARSSSCGETFQRCPSSVRMRTVFLL